MNNSFHVNVKFEQDGEKIFLPAFSDFLKQRGQSICVHSSMEQQKHGDYSIIKNGNIIYSIDRKHERSTSPNMFFEIYSNYKPNNSFHKLGWGLTETCDYIVYSFFNYNIYSFISLKLLHKYLDIQLNNENHLLKYIQDELYIIRNKSYRIVKQKTHHQKNLTIGILVPFKDIINCIVSTGEIHNKIFKKCKVEKFLNIAKR